MEGVRFDIQQPMICGSAEAEEHTYKLLIGKSGEKYLVAVQPNPADNIYVEGGSNSDGFGGRTLEFLLEDGTTIKLRGPWHTNSDDLFRHTGYDIRDKHMTIGICALEREKNYYRGDLFKGVLHKDRVWVIGEYDRIEKMAQAFSNKHGKTVFYAMKSQGGGSAGSCQPKEIS